MRLLLLECNRGEMAVDVQLPLSSSSCFPTVLEYLAIIIIASRSVRCEAVQVPSMLACNFLWLSDL